MYIQKKINIFFNLKNNEKYYTVITYHKLYCLTLTKSKIKKLLMKLIFLESDYFTESSQKI